MTIYQIAVTGQELAVTARQRIASDSSAFVRCEFAFGADWDGLTIAAQFTQGGRTWTVPLADGGCYLPVEIVPGPVDISVFGVTGETVRATTIPVTEMIYESGFVADGETPIPPTPDLYNALIGRIEDGVTRAEQAADKAEGAIDGTYWVDFELDDDGMLVMLVPDEGIEPTFALDDDGNLCAEFGGDEA